MNLASRLLATALRLSFAFGVLAAGLSLGSSLATAGSETLGAQWKEADARKIALIAC